MPIVNLFYLSKNTTGGWVTYTAHLMYGLADIGVDVRLYKIGNRTEAKGRNFGYSLDYKNISIEDGLKLEGSSVIVALQKNYREQAANLIASGSWLVVHDPAEFKNFELDKKGKYITIRKAVAKQVPGSIFVPHPYVRNYSPGTISTGNQVACSISRIDFDKHTDIILEANRSLSKTHKVNIYGFENRLYTKFKICPAYPEWKQSISHYSRERTTACEICHDHTFAVDMSIIKGDGGGTQYTFLEAMDAGSINIIHDDWVLPNDEMIPYPKNNANCLSIGTAGELAAVLKHPPKADDLKSMVLRSNVLLSRHSPKRIAQQFVSLLTN